MEDVQTLNQWALQGKMDFTKISYGVLPLILNNYQVLESGGALGKGVGPLLITNKDVGIGNLEQQTNNTQYPTSNSLTNSTIAIPGENTTAHLLFCLAYPNATNKKFMVFNEIENYVLQSPNTLGVIIHENRFTYQQKGLQKVMDLGNYWEQKMSLPIPLGGIVAHRKMNTTVTKKVDSLIQKSLQFAFDNYPVITDYVKQHSQEMEIAVMQQHIDLYVNHFSLALGVDGQYAVMKLLEIYQQLHPQIQINYNDIFIQSTLH
jgi:1,4-dihydroxy-6-naphthoate synthase